MSEFLRAYLTVAVFGAVTIALLGGVLGLGSLVLFIRWVGTKRGEQT